MNLKTVNNSNLHIINKVVLEVNTSSNEKGYYLKDNLDVFLKKELFPILGTYFDSLAIENPQQTIRIEKLDINFSVDNNLNFEDLKKQIINNVRSQLVANIQNNSNSHDRIENDQKALENVFHFIETGTNPWWNSFESRLDIDFEKELNNSTIDTISVSRFIKILTNPTQRTRFIKQCTNEQITLLIIKWIVPHLTKNDHNTITKIIHKINGALGNRVLNSTLSLTQRFLIWEITVLILLEKQEYEKTIRIKIFTLLYSLVKYSDENNSKIKTLIESTPAIAILGNLDTYIIELEKEKVVTDDTNTTHNLQHQVPSISIDEYLVYLKIIEGQEELEINTSVLVGQNLTTEDQSNYYVNNAGLILVHPFLKQLFENCNLLNKDKTIRNAELAVHLLHYVATGQEQEYEHKMIIEKFICNVPIAYPIDRNIILSPEMKSEVQEMFQGVLQNWEVMKKSSVALLQNEFLQRPGKLQLTDTENPRVIVERKTQDILLDSLPWNLSIIKLPWIKKIIYVDW